MCFLKNINKRIKEIKLHKITNIMVNFDERIKINNTNLPPAIKFSSEDKS
jgi:hypothetical protein